MNKRQFNVLVVIVVIAAIFFVLGWVGHNDMCMEVAQAKQHMEQCK